MYPIWSPVIKSTVVLVSIMLSTLVYTASITTYQELDLLSREKLGDSLCKQSN